MSYEDLEKAMNDKNDPNYQKYLKLEKKITQDESYTSLQIQ